jgi:chemotaxis-related protein WspD
MSVANAAARLLDREITPELSRSLSERALGGSAEEHAEKESVAVFRLGQEWFALPTTALDEIIAPRPVHTLPHRRHPALLGLINVRGQLVVCISVAQLLLGAPSAPAADRLLVARHAGGRFAFPVDEIQHTLQYPKRDMMPAPSTVARSASSYSKGLVPWRDRTIARLDEELLFEGLARCLA